MAVELLTVFYMLFKKCSSVGRINIVTEKVINLRLTIFLEFSEFRIGEKRFSPIKFTFKI